MRQDTLDHFLNSLGALFRTRRIFPPGQRQVRLAALLAAQRLSKWKGPVRITLLDDEAIIEDQRLDTLSSSLNGLFQSLLGSGCERVHIEADASAADLMAWIDHVVSKRRGPYRNSKIITGSLNLVRQPDRSLTPVQAVPGCLGLLSRAREALSDLESKKPEGLVRAKEIVGAIAGRLAVEKEIFDPLYELKDFDEYTFTHALNVSVLSSSLARASRLPKDMVNTICLAALCHDLGKKQIPREILIKEEILDPEERTAMEEHPVHGVRLLLDTPGVESDYPLLPVVAYQHHMGADHSGYPRLPNALSLLKLHPASLIVAVADIYDALRTVRPYRPALSVTKASSILLGEAMSGKLDKNYVSSFLMLSKVLAPERGIILSDGSRAVILEIRQDNPFAPVVEREDGYVYDLSQCPNLLIQELEEETLWSKYDGLPSFPRENGRNKNGLHP
jgi:HD-GYP domain-containing protein (c-di-GMP phosphodiesterase class II)